MSAAVLYAHAHSTANNCIINKKKSQQNNSVKPIKHFLIHANGGMPDVPGQRARRAGARKTRFAGIFLHDFLTPGRSRGIIKTRSGGGAADDRLRDAAGDGLIMLSRTAGAHKRSVRQE